MSKRLAQVIAVALLAIAMLLALRSRKQPTSDEARYQRWEQPIESFSRLRFLKRHLPTRLYEYFKLPAREERYLVEEDEILQALLASGYLTNVEIAVVNASANSVQIGDRLNKATLRKHAKWQFFTRSDGVVVLTCRPQDVALCTRAIENK